MCGYLGGSMHHQHQDGYSGPSSYHPLSPKGEHYYPPGHGPKDDHLFWSTHMTSYDHHVSSNQSQTVIFCMCVSVSEERHHCHYFPNGTISLLLIAQWNVHIVSLLHIFQALEITLSSQVIIKVMGFSLPNLFLNI